MPMSDPAERGAERPPETIALPRRGFALDPRKLLLLAVLCWAAFALVAALVLTDSAQALDRAGLLFWRQAGTLAPRGPEWLLESVRDITALGGVLLRNLFALAAVAALLFVRLRSEALVLAGTVASGWLVGWVLKLLVGRDRPEIVPHLMHAGGQSFPSGHSFGAATVYVAIALAFATYSARRSVRWTIVGGALVLSAAVAWSRVWLGVHFPTDVIAGWLGGTGWALLGAVLGDRMTARS